ncbi:alpha-amylase family glycosyl hydrolase [Kocuria sp. M1R5S2]|uniref:glycoside hydrolase family 13 protein n=1 Tax=Kocuria rhizosphaerae TaxID=3376285 RepID=UPI0037B52904
MTASSPIRSSTGEHSHDPDWWRQATVYQIYPRSFYDADGDGLGDIAGITAKVPYLAGLGVDAVWLSPFYPSALADGGYDVDDYRDVDPKLGTLADFDEMTAALHEAGIKLIVDIVPNHSSDRHAWFRQALASPAGSPARDRYVFRDGLGPDGDLPPSDWQSVFGGPAWERITEPDGTPGQWYLHLFAKEQPDFNWDNEEVRADFLRTLRFWSDRGVDGFRVDVAHALTKHLPESLPTWENLPDPDVHHGHHPFWDRDEVHEIYAQWRSVFDEYDPPRTAVAEAWVHPDRRARYASPEGLGQAFNFDLLTADFDAGRFRSIIAKNLAEAAATGASSTWVFSNHDVVRHPTRYGLAAEPADAAEETTGAPMEGGRGAKGWLLAGAPAERLDREKGLQRARAATLLMLALPGSAYLYQGEELGLHEVAEIAPGDRQDPAFFRNPGVDIGRDGCRVPLPWSPDGTAYGFSATGAHLPQPEWFRDAAAEAQERDPDSTLNLYRAALALRGRLQGPEQLDWVDEADPQVVHFARPGGWHSVTNFGSAPVPLPDGEILLASGPLEHGALPPATTAWILR